MRYAIIAFFSVILVCGSPTRAQIPSGAITDEEIEQRVKLDFFFTTHKQTARQDAINELADDKDKIGQAQRDLVDLSDARVERLYVEMCSRMHIPPDQLEKRLEAQGILVATLKNRIKADMARVGLARSRKYDSQDQPLDLWRR